jgi:S-DNA-T family DNA segregation ATPase FtsK/SpoIIIE
MGIDIEERQDENGHTWFNEITGVILSALGAFGLLCLIMPDNTGSVGRSVNEISRLIFGNSAYAIPIIMVAFGFVLLFRLKPRHFWLRMCGLVLLFLALLIALDMPVSTTVQVGNRPAGVGGGIVGAFFASIFLKAFAELGTNIILVVFLLVGIMLLFTLPLSVLCMLILTGFVALLRFIWQLILRGIRRVKELYNDFTEQAFPYSEFDLPPEAFGEDEENVGGRKKRERKKREKAASEPRTSSGGKAEKADGDRVKDEFSLPFFEPGKSEQLSLTNTGEGRGLPSILLLDRSPRRARTSSFLGQEDQSRELEETFRNFGMDVKVLKVDVGPIITRYELQLAPGIKVSRIVNLSDDIALALAAPGVRIEAPIPGKSAVGIEIPNKRSSIVTLREVLETDEFQNSKSPLSIGLGLDIAGNPVIADLKQMLHLLVAGATGSGKSVCINAMISSLLFKATPNEVRFLIIDPKMVELAVYNGIPHLVTPVVTDVKKAALALGWAVTEMERRYKLFSQVGVRNIETYNEKCEILAREIEREREREIREAHAREREIDKEKEREHSEGKEKEAHMSKHEKLPYLVVVIDELADLMMVAPGDVEDAICRLAQMARATGIHLIIATQRPSADVITGIIKANIPSRIAFAVASQIDSRIILDMNGAERLIGRGDMLFYPAGASKPVRVQGAYVSDREVEALVKFMKEHGETEYIDSVEDAQKGQFGSAAFSRDELFADAAEIVLSTGQASISMLQRKLRIGYARAARIIDELEMAGLVGPHEGSKPRAILLTEEEWAERCESEVAAGDGDNSL